MLIHVLHCVHTAEEFEMAAALIKAASDTFSRDIRGISTPKITPKATPTITRVGIDSTPRLVTKFETRSQGSTDEISRGSPSLSGSRPDTPSSLRAKPSSPIPAGESPIPDSDLFVARYDYKPMSDTELELHQGEVLVVLEKADNGWWHGLVGERHGWFPESFAESAPLDVLEQYRGGSSAQQSQAWRRAGRGAVALGPRRMSEFVAGTSEEVEASGEPASSNFSLVYVAIQNSS